MSSGTSQLYDLDSNLPSAGLLLGLARFEGSSLAVTRWMTARLATRVARFAVIRWQIDPEALQRPFFLCTTHAGTRDGLRLLIAEWLEYRRLEPTHPFRLLLRVRVAPDQIQSFKYVAQFWEQAAALKRQLWVQRANIYLSLHSSDAREHEFVDAASARVLVGNGSGEIDWDDSKPLIAPQHQASSHDSRYLYPTAPARLRLLGEPRNYGTSGLSIEIPEPFTIAHAVQLAARDCLAKKAPTRRTYAAAT